MDAGSGIGAEAPDSNAFGVPDSKARERFERGLVNPGSEKA
jgi:hypothetical protein